MFRFRSRAPFGGRARPFTVVFALGLALGGLLSPPPAGAQESGSGGVTIELVDQPVFYDADSNLDIRVRISNGSTETLEGFALNLGRESRLTSRSDLQDSFESPPGLAIEAITRVIGQDVAPDESRVVTLDDAVTEVLTTEAPTGDAAGIYPATINLLEVGEATPLDSLTTHLMYYPDEVESRLNFVMAVPLDDLPARGPDNGFVMDATDERPTLEEALGRRGWLTRTASEVNRLGGKLRLGLAPTPRLIEEIADMSNGYRRGDEQVSEDSPEARAAANLLEQLRDALDTDGVQHLLVPYANPDLPSMAANGIDGDLATQITLGETILSDVLEVDIDRSWLFPPGERTDAASLEQMRLTSNAGEKTFFSEPSLVDVDNPLLAGCPIEGLTATCPVSVSTQAGTTVGYQADPGLQRRLTELVREGDDRLNLQRFFAETAMIREEQPSRTDRIIQVTLPSLWHPSPALTRILYTGIANAPWLQTVTPEEGLELDIDRIDRRIEDAVGPVPHEISAFDYGAIEEAESTIESFNSIGPPPGKYQRLLRNCLVAQSRNWWVNAELSDRGLAFARASAQEARSEMDKISIEVSERITLTSRAEDIPVRVLNDAGYPVKVRFQLDSARLRFEDEEVRTFETGRTPLTIPVRADSSGFFPVTMALITPDGSEVIAESEPTVRSTEFNNVALTITMGALFFLIAFYVLRWYRRRNAAPPAGALEH
jgi:Family of unknown function (DUF6049)